MRNFKLVLAVVLMASATCVLADQQGAMALEGAMALGSALTESSRAEADKARDAGRKPAEVLSFLGIAEGMTVMDVIAAGGYYTEVLSIAVGPGGKVYAQNPAAVLQYRDGANDKALTARLADGRLANVTRWDRELDDVGLEAGSLDGAITALNFHDIYNPDPAAAMGMLQVIKGLLKPGGVLGIIDHAGSVDANNAELHRVEKAKVVAAAMEAGFEIAGDSDLLANSADDLTQMVFAPDIRGKTDRFLLKLVKPI
ncbi:MAG: class I SAM-dependent methyltransferase [Pseudomonadales bacterium]